MHMLYLLHTKCKIYFDWKTLYLLVLLIILAEGAKARSLLNKLQFI